jgi:predicted RNase H-like nuclease (RuvC/YqgF family)
MAVHRALGRIRDAYRAELEIMGSDHIMISRRTAAGEIICTRDDDSIFSYVQDLKMHIQALQAQVHRDTKKVKEMKDRETELEDNIREADFEHEDEVKDFLERIQNLKKYIANLEEKLDQGENLHPDGDDAPILSDDDDYDESTTGGGSDMDF